MAEARREELSGLRTARLLERLLGRSLVHAVPEAEKWVVTLAGGEITSIKTPGLCIIWPWEEVSAIIPTDVFEVNPGAVEFDMLRRQPEAGREGERILASVDAVGFARIINARRAYIKFNRFVDPETRRLSTERIIKVIMEMIVSVIKDYVLKYDYEKLVESPDRRGFDPAELKNRMNETFGDLGIVFDRFRISDPGATGEFREALDDVASARERARAQKVDAEADRDASFIRAEGTTARMNAILEFFKKASQEEGVSENMRNLILQMATLLEMTSEDRGPNAPAPVIVSGMGDRGPDPTSALVLAEIQRLTRAIEDLGSGGDGNGRE